MTLLFCDSFDHYATADILNKWTAFESSGTGQAIGSGNGRRSGNAWTSSNTLRGLLKAVAGSPSTLIVGGAFYLPSLPSTVAILGLWEGATIHVQLRVKADGAVEVTRNTTVLGTSSAGVISAATYVYVELKATINDSTGSYEVRVNGANVLSGTGADTRNGGTGVITQVNVNAAIANIRVDDFYICNTSGSANNDFLGDVRVDAYLPNGNGNSSQMTGSDADSTDNYLLVDDSAPDGDSTYVQSSTAGHKDTYTFADMSHTPSTIHGVQVNMIAKKDDAGARSIASVVRSGGTDTDGTTQALSTSYLDYMQIIEQDPNTSAAWTKTGFNAAEFGHTVAA